MAPAFDIHRALFLRSPKAGMIPYATREYVGEGLILEEKKALEYSDDLYGSNCIRRSGDNGRTWSAWETVSKEKLPVQGDCSLEEIPWMACFDPVSGKNVRHVFQRIIVGDPAKAMERWWRGGLKFYFDHGFYQIGDAAGLQWTEHKPFRYEEGEPFHPEDWGHAGYLRRNQLYAGTNMIATSRGTLVFAATVPVPYLDDAEELKLPDGGWIGRVAGIRAAVGRWNPRTGDYDWQWSAPFWLPRRVSSRGLMEPSVAELADGRLLVDMRGANDGAGIENRPGRRWISTSPDGGLTWTPITDLRYDTGETFHSPSSIAKLLRHAGTGKLYWFGNLSDKPVFGSGPRYPLVMAEVDESGPTLKKNTVTVIDDRDPAFDPPALALSNFCVREDRESHTLEVLMTRPDRPDADGKQEQCVWRYTITPR